MLDIEMILLWWTWQGSVTRRNLLILRSTPPQRQSRLRLSIPI